MVTAFVPLLLGMLAAGRDALPSCATHTNRWARRSRCAHAFGRAWHRKSEPRLYQGRKRQGRPRPGVEAPRALSSTSAAIHGRAYPRLQYACAG